MTTNRNPANDDISIDHKQNTNIKSNIVAITNKKERKKERKQKNKSSLRCG